MSMLASMSDTRSLVQIMEEGKLTAQGAARLKGSGALADLVKIANRGPLDLLGVTDLGLPFFQAFTEAGWTTQEMAKLLQDQPQLKLWHHQYGGLKESSPEAGKQSDESCLRLYATFTLPARVGKIGQFAPATFYVTQTGRFISEQFTKNILSVAQPVSFVPELLISCFDLRQEETDTQIHAALPQGYVFPGASVFCSYLAGMLKRQPNSAAGPLLTNGSANIFYVVGVGGEVFAVSVEWNIGCREWGVDSHLLGCHLWHADDRVFSRTAAAA